MELVYFADSCSGNYTILRACVFAQKNSGGSLKGRIQADYAATIIFGNGIFRDSVGNFAAGRSL